LTQDEGEMVPASEFSRLFKIEPQMGTGEDAFEFSIEAGSDECVALAERFRLISIEVLKVEGSINIFAFGRQAHLAARLVADVTQTCVVSLAPVSSHLEEDLIRDYDSAVLSDTPVEIGPDFDITALDPPDPLPRRQIDVGEVAAEQLGLALDPYPHAEAVNPVTGPDKVVGKGDKTASEPVNPHESPFSVLRRLKDG